MSRKAQILLGLLGVGLMVWSLYWFFQNYERVDEEIQIGISPAARRNPLLAAERFLARLGLEAQSISGRDWLLNPPSEPGVLIVHYLGPSLPEPRERQLLRWIEDGGHLIVTAEREWDEAAGGSGNHLLDSLGLRVNWSPEERETDGSESDRPADVDAAAAKPGDPAQGSGVEDEEGCDCGLVVEYPGYPYPLEVALAGARHLYDAEERAHWWVEDEQGDRLLQYRIGDGLITVLSDNGFLGNDEIGKRDHALFLALLAGDQRRAWLLYSSDMPSLLQLLWQKAPYLVISFLVLCGLSLWRLTRRTGPLLLTEVNGRRNLMEHLDAAAGYAWRVDRAKAMVQASREGLETAWRRRLPGLGRADRQSRCAVIAERTGLAPRAVEQALYGDIASEQAFIRTSAIQQKLAVGLNRAGGDRLQRESE